MTAEQEIQEKLDRILHMQAIQLAIMLLEGTPPSEKPNDYLVEEDINKYEKLASSILRIL